MPRIKPALAKGMANAFTPTLFPGLHFFVFNKGHSKWRLVVLCGLLAAMLPTIPALPPGYTKHCSQEAGSERDQTQGSATLGLGSTTRASATAQLHIIYFGFWCSGTTQWCSGLTPGSTQRIVCGATSSLRVLQRLDMKISSHGKNLALDLSVYDNVNECW